MFTVIGGPMFAGKTTWLIDYARTLPAQSFRLFKPEMDTRYGRGVCMTHGGDHLPAVNIDAVRPVFPTLEAHIKTVLIDELNFFHPAPLLAAIREFLTQKIEVIGAGLLYDFEKKPFGATLPFSRVADRFVPLYAVCDNCGEQAAFNYRKVAETRQVMLGAGEAYGAACEGCWSALQSA